MKFLTFTNWGSLEICLNMTRSLQEKGGVDPGDIVIETVDDESFGVLSGMNLPYVIGRFSQSAPKEYLNFCRDSGSSYSKLMSMKSKIIKKYYDLYGDVLYIDNDVIFKKNITHYVAALDKSKTYFQNESFTPSCDECNLLECYEKLVPSSSNEFLCCGFVIYFKNETSDKIIELAQSYDGKENDDQVYAHNFIRKNATLKEKITLLNRDEFPNGWWMYSSGQWGQTKSIAKHYNWILGKKDKIQQMIRQDDWQPIVLPNEVRSNGKTYILPTLPTLPTLRGTDENSQTTPIIEIKQWENAKPIFILGDARTGTSYITKVLLNSLVDYRFFYHEGHLWQVLGRNKAAWAETLAKNLVEECEKYSFFLSNKELLYFRSILQNSISERYVTSMGERFIDKSPGYYSLYALREIQKSFPNAKIIITKRRCLEAILSRMKKFPSIPFEDNVKAWWRSHAFIARNSDYIHKNCLLIENFDCAHKNDFVLNTLANFLNVDKNILHKTNGILSLRTPIEKTNTNNYAAMSLEKTTDFTTQQKRIILDTCTETMDLLGYSWDESYYQKTT